MTLVRQCFLLLEVKILWCFCEREHTLYYVKKDMTLNQIIFTGHVKGILLKANKQRALHGKIVSVGVFTS